MISALRNFFRELNNSIILEGNPLKQISKDTFYKNNITILNFIGKFLIGILFIYSAISFGYGEYRQGTINVSVAVILMIVILYLEKSQNYPIAARSIILFCLVFTLYLFQMEVYGSGLFLWTLTAPMFLVFFLKIREGTILAIIYYGVNIGITSLGLFNARYSFRFLVRYSGVYLTLVVLSYIYGRLQEEATEGLLRSNKKLNQTIRDLSAAERDLSKSEEQYRSLVENSNDGIGILQDFKFMYVNTKLCTMSGFSRDQLLHQPLVNVDYRQ